MSQMPAFDTQHQVAYLQTLQQLIARMHSASQTSKQVCVGLVAAIITFGSATKSPLTAFIAVIPILTLWFLDGYYLSVERDFIVKYNDYSTSLRESESSPNIHDLKLNSCWWCRPARTALALISFSIWPFYLALLTSAVLVALLGDRVGFADQ